MRMERFRVGGWDRGGGGEMGEMQRMQQNRPIERRRLCKVKVLFILQLNGTMEMHRLNCIFKRIISLF